ncbi:MAG: hypothetical protein SAJ12_02820 [Jaaginema sp. PMC 1079.18]|nr:hypothetical protein [Jaaginema sp. PMC 1080.18]MEC4849920.1 hypothetical protein [Jaaginema sp. PMC 1079.18]MEC4864892.1 hypothetical protein [Jaaginema sp. PMC 1078.18]
MQLLHNAHTRPTVAQPLKTGTWVSLHSAIAPYSHDEALLLCPISATTWVTWIPGYGEATLSVEQFQR